MNKTDNFTFLKHHDELPVRLAETAEARYEGERATLPVTLIDIDYRTNLIVTH